MSIGRVINAKTIFLVFNLDADADDSTFLLGDTENYHLNRGVDLAILHDTHAAISIINGITRMNGSIITPTTEILPTVPTILSIKTKDGPVAFNTISKDRDNSNRLWKGDYAEIIVYNVELHDGEILEVNSYLSAKWGIAMG